MKRSAKRWISWVLALIATFGAAGSGFCAFDTGSLVQVVYKSDDVEVGTDLLDLSAADLSQQNVTLAPAGTVSLDQFVTTDQWADLSLGYFAYDGTYVYFATTESVAPSVVSRSWSSFIGAVDGVLLYYDTLGAGPTVVGVPTHFSSYWVKMNSGTTPGQYAGLNSDFAVGEATLEALDAAGGYVDMYLYKFRREDREVYLVPGATADYQAVLRIRFDGSTVLNPVEAPFELVRPANGARLSSAPTFEWTAGSYDVYGLYMVLPISGKYSVKHYWTYDTSFRLSSNVWNTVTKNKWAGWFVIGLDPSVTPVRYEVLGPRWFQKTGP